MKKVDIKALKQQAESEIAEEIQKVAVEKLKELYRSKAKALQVVKNLDREIDSYLSDVEAEVIHSSASAK